MPQGDVIDLKVSVKDGKGCEKILTVEVEQEEIQKEYDSFYKAVTPKAKIPGFRPGKAPRDVIKMHYAKEAREEVLKHLVSDTYRNALNEKGLVPLGYPDVQDIKFDEKQLSYKAVIEVRPTIKLSKTSGLNVKRKAPEVKPEETEEGLKQLQESLAQFKVVDDRPSQMGDVVIADYVCTIDGNEVDKRTDDWIEIKEKEFLEGFSVQLVGLKAGDEKEVKMTFPEKIGRPELAGKEAVFQVKTKEIKTKLLPPLNDDLAKDAGEYENLDQLREKINKDIKAKKETELEAEYEKALLDELMKHNKVNLPEKMVEKRFEHLLEDAKSRLMSQGMPEEEFEKHKEKLSKDLEPEARRQVHVAFLLDEIAIKENVTVTDQDLEEKYKAMGERFRQPADVIKKYYAEHPDAVENVKEQIRNEKTIQFLKKNAKS